MLGIVIPAHNEALLIGASVDAVMAAARHPDLRGEPVEVVVLDACSDATGVIAARAGARWLAFTDADTVVSPCSEDVALVRALEATGARIAWSAKPRVITSSRRDGRARGGHPDHEATGHASAFAAARRGAGLVEVPVWAWHWAAPGDRRLPWVRAWRLDLDAPACRRKQSALRAFASQLEPDASTGRTPILRATTLERAARPFEVFFA